ncbi:response regulator [Rhizobacter sp. Root1221]|uniref:response regulator n=1 Tax=Rhizobacter sp. Root1221 TaxID=1736433 RepID=UPI0006F8836E|nr:response regulator [Rhizobacter sp. Root1221]KQW00377.1 hypothetical protein ASC87_17620 [Rhizobacter sp. Root1221]
MGQLSVRQWAIAGLSAGAVLILALAGFSWNSAQESLEASKFVNHTHLVIGEVARLQSNLDRAEADHRAFMMSRREAFAEGRDQWMAKFDASVGTVSRLTLDNPAQQDRLAELRRIVMTRINVIRDTEQMMRSNGSSVDLVQRLDEGVRVLHGARGVLDEMAGEEQRLLAEREKVETDRAAVTEATFATLIVVILLMLPVVYWRVRRDLVARQEAERRVAQNARYEELHAQALTLYNSQPDRHAVVDGTLQVLAGNPQFLCSAFYAHEEIGGMLRLAATHAAPSDAQPLVRLGDGPLGLAGRTMLPVEINGVGQEGGFRIETGLAALSPATVLFSPVMFQGHLSGVLVLAAATRLDDGDRRFLERLCAQWGVALHNLSQMTELGMLADQLRARGEDIQQKNAELSKADRMKSEFLANMSHELRTPLNAVIGFSEILKDGMVGDLTPEQREYITDIFTSGKHLLSLINDILDLSKVESGHSPLELEALEPIQLSGSGMSVMREKASTQHVRLRAVCEPDQGSLMVDLRKSKQIVYNLLANAVKFTPEGGHVTLSLQRATAAEVKAACNQRYARAFPPANIDAFSAYLAISVTDTGIGIARKDLERLFQPFVQIDSSLSRKYAGTGLGLMMVKRLAELHGGGMLVTSEPEQGSTFTVWLPWREATAEQIRLAPDVTGRAVVAALPPSKDAPVVLVVEDDARAASMIVSHLEGAGYRVELARSAEEGLHLASHERPSVIVLDIILPGIDGWDMLLRMKDREETRNIPVVIVSVTDERRRGFALGASQVLAKPVDPDDLLAAVASVDLGNGRKGARVLVVDDDPKAVTLVSKHLEVAGFMPVGAYGGAEALALARDGSTALIILDLMMPAVSGFDVVRALRADPATADIPIIVLTAKLLNNEDRTTLHGQVQQVLEKAEFLPASLLAEVRRALARHRHVEENV